MRQFDLDTLERGVRLPPRALVQGQARKPRLVGTAGSDISATPPAAAAAAAPAAPVAEHAEAIDRVLLGDERARGHVHHEVRRARALGALRGPGAERVPLPNLETSGELHRVIRVEEVASDGDPQRVHRALVPQDGVERLERRGGDELAAGVAAEVRVDGVAHPDGHRELDAHEELLSGFARDVVRALHAVGDPVLAVRLLESLVARGGEELLAAVVRERGPLVPGGELLHDRAGEGEWRVEGKARS